MQDAPRRILIIQLRRIGDVILSMPAASALKKIFPAAAIDFLAEPACAEIPALNPDISETLVYDKKRAAAWPLKIRARGYDWVIDYLGNPRSGFITAASGAKIKAGPGNVFWTLFYNRVMPLSPAPEYSAAAKTRMLRSLGLDPDLNDTLPRLAVKQELAGWAREFLRSKNLPGSGKKLVAFAPASLKPTRQYPARHYAKLASLIAKNIDSAVMLLWGPQDKALAQAIAAGAAGTAFLAPETPTLSHLGALLAEADLMVTNCNGPKHLAVAVGTPTLTIHASSDPRVWTPASSPMHQHIRREDLPCIGCRLNSCPRGLECLDGLPPEQVLARVLAMLKK